MNKSTTLYRAIADETRRRILDLLREKNLTAGAIAERFPKIKRPAVSRHLAILRRSRLVTIEKRGRERLYALSAAPLRTVADWVREYEAVWDEQLRSLKDYVESESIQEESDDES